MIIQFKLFENYYQVGDTIYCIDNRESSLILGGEYTVTDTTQTTANNYVRVDGKFEYPHKFINSFIISSRFTHDKELAKKVVKQSIQNRFDL